jgi:hypothetical protein
MKSGFLLALLALPAAVGLALADPCSSACVCLPGETMPPVTLFRQPPRPCPVCAPAEQMPPITIFSQYPSPPNWAEAAPLPPVELFTQPPPVVETFPGAPPAVALFRKESSCPVWVAATPPPPLTLFRRKPTPLQTAPCVTLPPITLIRQPPPCAATVRPCESAVCPDTAVGVPGVVIQEE